MEFYRNIVSPGLDVLPSEPMHKFARRMLNWAEHIPGGLSLVEQFAYGRQRFSDPRLNVTIGKDVDPSRQVHLDNRLVLAAGWDKLGISVAAWYRLGAAVSVGAVLEHPQIGNPEPRQWYFGGRAVNRLGFNSPGMEKVAKNLRRYKGEQYLKFGVNISINKDVKPSDAPEAFATVFRKLYRQMAWAEINVSSPNTKDLRLLQDPVYLRDIDQALMAVMDEMGYLIPIYHKVAPDLDDEGTKGVVRVSVDNGFSGMIASNTTVKAEIKGKYNGVGGKVWSEEMGGLSGDDPDYRAMTTHQVALIRRETTGVANFEIHGVGGVNSFEAALEKLLAGADVISFNTGVRQVGLTLPGRINRAWSAWMDKVGIKSKSELQSLVGSKVDRYI